MIEGKECLSVSAISEEAAIDFLEFIANRTVDTSGEKVILSDGSSYVDIIKSNIDGIFYYLTFGLNGVDDFEAIVATEEYFNSENYLLFPVCSTCLY